MKNTCKDDELTTNVFELETIKKDKISILIIDLAKHYGGAEVRVFDLAKALHGRCQYSVATLINSPLHQRLNAAKLISLPVPYSRGDPRLLFFLLREIRRAGYQVVDAHNPQSQFWGLLAAKLAKTVVKVSTVHSAYRFEHSGSPKGRVYEFVLRLNALWGCNFIAVSESINTYLQKNGIPSERINLIHNSLSLPARSSSRSGLPLLQSLGWGKEAYVVIVVARLEPVKGHTFFIEAFRKVAKEFPQLRCLIVGEGRLRSELDDQIRKFNLSNRVYLTGYRDDVPSLLRESDVFCLPSLSEGLPYALLEACAYKLPLLVTRVGGMADLLTHKQTAFFVPPSDSEALAAGLRWLINSPKGASQLGQAAFSWLQHHFNPEEMIAKTLAVYNVQTASV